MLGLLSQKLRYITRYVLLGIYIVYEENAKKKKAKKKK